MHVAIATATSLAGLTCMALILMAQVSGAPTVALAEIAGIASEVAGVAIGAVADVLREIWYMLR